MEAKCLPPANMVSTTTQKRMSLIRDLEIPLVSTLLLAVYSEFLFSSLGQNFVDLCTDTVNPYFAEGTLHMWTPGPWYRHGSDTWIADMRAEIF